MESVLNHSIFADPGISEDAVKNGAPADSVYVWIGTQTENGISWNIEIFAVAMMQASPNGFRYFAPAVEWSYAAAHLRT